MTRPVGALAAALLAASASLPVAPAAVRAQSALVDEGTFAITREGQTIGREQFSIRSRPGAGGGASFIANGTTSYSDRRLDPRLETDAAGAPVRYVVETRIGAERQEMLSGQIQRGRFSARTQTPRGESAREYIVAEGAVILDDDIFHQYYFLAQSARSGAVPVVVPRRNVQITMRVESGGAERITIGGRVLDGRRLTLSEPGGERREILVDAQGRVLRVVIPSRGITALRDDPPA